MTQEASDLMDFALMRQRAEASAADLLETITALQADFDAMKAAFEECTAHCLEALVERNDAEAHLVGAASVVVTLTTERDEAAQQRHFWFTRFNEIANERDEARRWCETLQASADETARKLEQAQTLIDKLYTAWWDAPLEVSKRDDRINAMTEAALLHNKVTA